MNQVEYYYPEPAWEIIKSYILMFDKARKTKTAKLMIEPIEYYRDMIENGDMIKDTPFSFVYFVTYMKYRKKFDYAMFPNRLLFSS